MRPLSALALLLWGARAVWGAPIPPESFPGFDFNPPLEDGYVTGEAILVAGEVADPGLADGQFLLQFVPADGGESEEVFVGLAGQRFRHYHLFAHERSGTYALNLFAGGAGATQLAYVGTHEGVVVGQGSGPIELPADFFPGVRLDAPLPTVFTTSAALSLAGEITDGTQANGQILFNFVAANGDEIPVFIGLDGLAFRRGYLFTGAPAGPYDLEVYLGGEGESLAFVGQFPVELIADGASTEVPADFFAGVIFDQPVPVALPVQRELAFTGTVAPGVFSLRFDISTAVRDLFLEVPVAADGRFAAALRLDGSELGAVVLQVVREEAGGLLVDSGSFEFTAVEPPPAPALSLGALSLGLLPGGEAALPLENVGPGVLSGLRYEIEGPFALDAAPAELGPGARAEAVLRYEGDGGDYGALLVHSDDPQRPSQRVALNGLRGGAMPRAFVQHSADAEGFIDVDLDLDRQDYALVLYAAEVAALGRGLRYPFALGGPLPAARRGTGKAGGDFYLALRQRERTLAARYRNYGNAPAAKPAAAQQLGARRQFIFDEAEAGVPRQRVAATLVAVSERAQGWLQDDLRDHEMNVAAEDVAALIAQFSDEDYQRTVATFGRPSDVDGDGRIAFLFTHLVDDLENVAGFYAAAAVLPEDAGGDGNRADLLFISPTQRRADYRSLLVHEFQHLINFNEHVLVRRGEAEVTWLNEGLSHVAEDLVADFSQSGNGGNIADFLREPEAVSLEPEADDDAKHRGAAYLFVRSLADRMGPGVLSRLVATGLADRANVEAATGEGLAELLAAWGTQLYVSGLGLSGHPRFNYTSDLLRAGEGRGFALPGQREYRWGESPLAGTVPFRGLAFVRVRGSGRQALSIATDPAGRVGVVAIPLTREFAARARVPADYVPGVRFERLVPADLVAGRAYDIGGTFLAEEVRDLILSFTGPDSLDFFAEVDGAEFTATIEVPRPGAYSLAFFTGPGGTALRFAADFGPVWVRDDSEPTAVAAAILPGEYSLGRLYPNPFNASVVVPVSAPAGGGRLEVAIYNALGQRVRLLHDGVASGAAKLIWDGRGADGRALASGVYFARAQAPGFAAVRRVALVR